MEWDRPESQQLAIEHAVVRFANHGISIPAGSSPSIANSIVRDNAWNGISMSGGSATLSANVLRQNAQSGIYFKGSGAPEIANNVLEDNYATGPVVHGGGIHFEVPTNATASVNIHDNVVDGNGSFAGIRFWQASGSATVNPVSFANNEATGNSGRALQYQVAGALPADIVTTPEPTGNGSNALYVSGRISQSLSWSDPGYPIVLIGGYDLTVDSGKTLTLGPGIVVKGETTTSDLVVNGNLIAQGAPGARITFSSLRDDSVGGDTNGDGSATVPAAGNWGGIDFQSFSTGTLDQVDVSWGGSSAGSPAAALRVSCNFSGCPQPPTIRHARFVANTTGLYVTGNPPAAASPIVSRSSFQGHSVAAIDKSGTSVMSAPSNTFPPCNSGPAPAGCGDFVGSKVDPSPVDEVDPAAECQGEENDCPVGGDPVSLATGSFYYPHTDLRLTNKAGELAFARSYNSSDRTDSGLGLGWSHTGLFRISESESGDALVRNPDGELEHFQKVGGAYDPLTHPGDSLTKLANGGFRLQRADRSVLEFLPSGSLDKVTDDHGLVTDYVYSAGRLSSITDPSGQSLAFTYNTANRITKVSDSTGREVAFTYDASGLLSSATDALGKTTTYAYDAGRRLRSITDPRDIAFISNVYDAQGRVAEQTDGEGNVWGYEYAAGQTTVIEPEGGEIVYGFDAQKRMISRTNQLGYTTTFGYDLDGNVDEITKPGGATTALDYDARGNLISSVDPEGGTRSYSYDAQNRLTSFTDERSKTWTYDWSAANDLTKITDPATGAVEIVYNASGRPTSIEDANNHATALSYDTRGNLTSVTNPLAETTSFGYDSYNNLTSRTEPGKAAEAFGRNALGDLTSHTTPEGHITSYAYDANGALIKVTDPALNEWQIERDNMEHPTAYVDPLLNETTIAYDDNLNPVSVTDRRGFVTTYDYDLANQLTAIDPPATGLWQFGYDARGNRDGMIDPRSNSTTYDYDLADRMTAVHEPLSTSSAYGYDAAGNLTSVTDPRSNQTTFAYDSLGRLDEMIQPLAKTTTYDYDFAGNLIGRTTAEGALDLDYDAANRLTSISDGATALRSFAYDDAGRLIEATDAQSKTIALGWDDDDRLVSIDDGRGQTVARTFDSRGNLTQQIDGRGTLSYAYDELSRMTSLTDPQSQQLSFDYDVEGNLTETALPNGVVTANTYDGAGRMLSTESVAGATTLQSFDYGYDTAGNPTTETDRNNDITAYAYDALNRLTEFDPPGTPMVSYGYDSAGNRTSADGITSSFNALNQLTSSSDGTTYSYDGAGRLIARANGSQSETYRWDALDQLLEVDDGTSAVAYSYDALGRRAERTEAATAETTHYGDVSDTPIFDADSNGITQSFVNGPVGLVEQRSGSTEFPLADTHGDIMTLTDGSGAAASRHDWDPWGEQLSGPSLEMGWLGAQQRRADPATGLVQMGVRSYEPGLGRFLSEDPVLAILGHGITTNRHQYAGDNPIRYTDLTGEFP